MRISGNELGMIWYAEALRRLGFGGRTTIRFQRTEKGSAITLVITGKKDVSEFYELLKVRDDLHLDRKWLKLDAMMERRSLEEQQRLELARKLVEAYSQGQAVGDLARGFRIGTKRVKDALIQAGLDPTCRRSPTRVGSDTERAIVTDYSNGLTQGVIAERYGLTQPRISAILGKHGVETVRRTSAERRMTSLPRPSPRRTLTGSRRPRSLASSG